MTSAVLTASLVTALVLLQLVVGEQQQANKAIDLELPFKVGILSDRYGDVLADLQLRRSSVFEEFLSGAVTVNSTKEGDSDAGAAGGAEEFARVTVEQQGSDCGNVRIFRASQKELDDDNIKPYVSFRYCLKNVDGKPTSTGEYVGEGKSKGHFNLQVLSQHEFRLQLLDAFYANQTTVHAYSTPKEAASSSGPWYMKFGIIIPVVLMFGLKTWLEVLRTKQERKQKVAAALAAQKKK